jgi:FkbM family methyltransferase
VTESFREFCVYESMNDVVAGMQALVDDEKKMVRNVLPTHVAYASYLKALFQNEIELRLLPWLCDPDLTSIDVGAYTGTYTIGPSIHSKDVIGIEPQPRQAEALRRSMPGNVRVMEAALSNTSGGGLLKVSSPEGGSMSRLDPVPTLTDGWPEVSVQVMRMDDLSHGRVGFVKIDAKGHEVRILQGALRIIALDRPIFLIEAEERHQPGAVAAVAHFLGRFGYEGCFVYRGEIFPIEEFDPLQHQGSHLKIGGRRNTYSDYINNFIFMPNERALVLPRSVPSASQALWKAVHAWRLKSAVPFDVVT